MSSQRSERSTSDHARTITDQFTRQARDFAAAPELHNDEALALLIAAGRPQASDRVLDIACGPGTVVAAFAAHSAHAIGIDTTPAMLDQALALTTTRELNNVAWVRGGAYALPFAPASFAIVVSRFAFHHLEQPAAAFAEMRRVAAVGARIVLCDAVAADDPCKAAAFNAMERWRDPSTVAFRPLAVLEALFGEHGLELEARQSYQVPYLAHEFVERAFPADGDRAGLLALIESSVDGDLLGMNARRTETGVHFAFQTVVLSAVVGAVAI